MKAVIFVLAVVVAMAGKAQAVCENDPQYTEKIDPVVCNKAGFKLPNYENATLYYQCTTQVQSGASVLTAVPTSCAQGASFNYAMQRCMTCDTYFPSAQCSSLPIDVTCVPIATTVAPTTVTTIAPTTASTTVTTAAPTTAAPGESTTAAPGESTTVAVPVPPTESPSSTTASGSDDIITPTGTTIYVPQPPSPNDNNVPTPVTPAPTAPVINDGPPTAPSAGID
ncbi:peritrophin-55 [Drosophila mauritiana]|uniref:Peritrophin-55 n=1 Tax=Drosophila mauritiana TaxID=7226 RepID=A0A6P8KEW5_DROMA|nr:peritrophin-55 [Drosophila mauritiana]